MADADDGETVVGDDTHIHELTDDDEEETVAKTVDPTIAHTSESSKEPLAHRPVLAQPVAQHATTRRTYEQACCHTNVVPSVDPNDPLIRLNVAARDLLNANRVYELSAFASYWVVKLAEPMD